MNDLLSRLKVLTVPSRELDAEIALAFDQVPVGMERADVDWWAGGGKQWHALRYTESIDAALTLLRTGQVWTVGTYRNAYVASIDGFAPTFAATPAIALVIACLKAKEASKP